MINPGGVALAIERKYGDGNWSFELREAICDAILAAKAEEREACALTLEDFGRDYRDRFEAADAIRKRGEG